MRSNHHSCSMSALFILPLVWTLSGRCLPIFVLLGGCVLSALCQELVPLVPSQEQELVDAHNNGRIGVTPLPCSPLLSVGWDALLAAAAEGHSRTCQQALQSQAQRRAALERVVAEFNVISTPSVIGQSTSVIITSDTARLPLREAVTSAFQLGKATFNHTLNLCVSPTGGSVSASAELQCRQYADMVTSSVTSVGCAVAQCSTIQFSDSPEVIPIRPGESFVYVLNCLYAPIADDLQTPDGILLQPPYQAGCDSSSTGNSTATDIVPTVSSPTMATVPSSTTESPEPPIVTPAPGTEENSVTQAGQSTMDRSTLAMVEPTLPAMTTTERRRVTLQRLIDPPQRATGCRGRKRRKRELGFRRSDSNNDSGSNSGSSSSAASGSSDEDCSDSDSFS